MLKNLTSLVESEPAFAMGVVAAGLDLATGFGLHITTHQTALIGAFAAAVASLITRAKVSPLPPSA